MPEPRPLALIYTASGSARTQQEIASHLGTTRESVARALGQLASAKHIRTGRRRIVITDPIKLAERLARRDRG